MVSRDELFHEISMPYQDLVDYLKEKYGPARYNYFYKDNCRSRRPEVSRTTEELICHHIREDMGGNLSNKSQAIIQPYEWQLKQNLVYCNLLEHLLLHFKIAVLRQKAKLKQPYDILQFFTTDGIYMVANQINGLFKKNGTQTKWLNNLYIAIRDNYSDYTLLLSALMRYIDSQYIGPRDIDSKLVIGAKVNFSDCSAEVLKVSSRKDVFLLKMPDGSSKPFYTSSFYKQLSYQDAIDITILDLSKDISIEGPPPIYKDIYTDIVNCNDMDVDRFANALSVDFIGYGFPQFSDFQIDRDKYGASSADEYVSNSIPSFFNCPISIEKKLVPHFWTGPIPTRIRNNLKYQYVVRIRTAFRIKDGEEPFVRYKPSIRATSLDNHNNLLLNEGLIISCSDCEDQSVGDYLPTRTGKDGKSYLITTTVTLTRDDFIKFGQTHNIWFLDVLDGCYFS